MKSLAGSSEKSISPRVATRNGLPLIIPKPLRDQMITGQVSVIRGVLTLFSIYRVIPSYPVYKLNTITDKFRGKIQTLPSVPNLISLLSKSFRVR